MKASCKRAPAERTKRLVGELASAHADVEAEVGKVVAISATSAEGARSWDFPFPLLLDEDSALHRRVGALDKRGRAAAALFITDRYREIYAAMRSADPEWPERARDVLQWLQFINIQCPECAPE